jgi:hypothetical protein
MLMRQSLPMCTHATRRRVTRLASNAHTTRNVVDDAVKERIVRSIVASQALEGIIVSFEMVVAILEEVLQEPLQEIR